MSHADLDLKDSTFAEQVHDFQYLMSVSQTYGGTKKGGLTRITGSREDQGMRDFFCAWLKKNALDVHIDPVGNIFGCAVFDPALPFLLSGSHLDSQPCGGQFDGVYGVMAAAATVKHIQQRVCALDVKPKVNLAVVCWTNEEGVRFQPSLTGSSYFVGKASLEQTWNIQDTEQISFKTALEEIGYLGEADFQAQVQGYVELHVEQGGLLEQRQKTIGIVEGTWAALKLKIKFIGEQNHTGPAPMSIRKDALLAASHAIVSVRAYADLYPEQLHTSVGKIENIPNSPNIVPESTIIYLEIRSIDEALILDIEQRLLVDFNQITAKTATHYDIVSRHFRPRVILDQTVQDELLQISQHLGLSNMTLKTIAGHDAISLSEKVPSNLIFIPSESGLSHNEAEFSSEQDLISGMQVLTHYLEHKVGLKKQTDVDIGAQA